MKSTHSHLVSSSWLKGAFICLLGLACANGFAQAIDSGATTNELPPAQAVSTEIDSTEPVALSLEALKKKVIRLNRDLFILEEDLLFPANTQFTVFLSLDSGEFLRLDSVKLKVDDEIVATHLYTDRQTAALKRGGMQRLHMGNLKSGEHEITVFVEGLGPDERHYKKAASTVIEKGTELKALEVKIRDRSNDYQPDVSIVEWD